MRIAIVDYELGNLRSVAGAVERLGHTPVVTNAKEELAASDKLILPGVGAFGDGMANLHRLGLAEILNELVIAQGKPILGICLGCELMAKESEEFGHHEGLGWIDASVIRLEPPDKALRIPHVGWNDLIKTASSVLFQDIPDDALFYYVHSYQVKCHSAKLVVGESDYGLRFTSVYQQRNVFATQFHPEKSQAHGLTLLKNFIEHA